MNTPQQRGGQAVPEGWRLVPVEPTPKQIGDGIRALMDAPDLGGIVEPYLPEVVDAYKAMLTSAPPAPSVGGWMPISEAPIGREMFVAKAFRASPGFSDGRTYDSDPWCVWQEFPGMFARWPHPFPPTHFVRLSDLPQPPKEKP